MDGRSISNLVLLSTPSLVGGQDGAINPINTGLRDAVELYQDGAVKKNRDVGDWAGRLPGLPSPGGNGILSTQNSQNSPRELQLTLRLTW